MIYLDNSATTHTLEAAAEAAKRYMTEGFYNPASAYRSAVDIEADVEAARRRLADALTAVPEEIIYTSGGTESNNIACTGVLRHRPRPAHIVCSAVEHPSVYQVVMEHKRFGQPASLVGTDTEGRVNLNQLQAALRPDTAYVSVMHVNNELGAINDIVQIGRVIKRLSPNAVFHVDGVQAFAKLPFERPPCDLYSISGHKFNAPRGIGALYVRRGVRFYGGQVGGGQERDLRSGTLNVPGIMGMDAALAFHREHQQEHEGHLRGLKARLLENLSVLEDIMVNGPSLQAAAPHILNVSFLGVRGEVLLHAVDAEGLCVSTGSACSASKKGKNRILEAIGAVGARMQGAIRFSFSYANTMEEMDQAAEIIIRQVRLLRQYQRR